MSLIKKHKDIIVICILWLLFFLCTSCSTTRSTVSNNTSVSSTNFNKENSITDRRDSIVYRDSVITIIQTRNDTVYITKDRVQYRFKEHLLRDSIYINVADTVVVEKFQEKVITKSPSLMERFYYALAGAVIVGIILVLIRYVILIKF